jgi:GTP 3',8-cyclase
MRKVPREEVLSYEDIARFVSLIQARYAVTHLRLTGGEPLARPKIETLVTLLAEAGIPDVALTTCGQQLAAKAQLLRQAGLSRINISLDSLNPATFAEITRGGVLEKTLLGIAAARQAGLHPIKLNMVVLRGQNDHEIVELVRFAIAQQCQMRFLELMPIGAAKAGFQDYFVPTAEVLDRLAGKFSLRPLPVDPGSTSRNFIASSEDGHGTTVGFVSPHSEPFCGDCLRLRLTAAGMLIGCLARPIGIPLLPLLRRGSESDVEALYAAVERALGTKRRNADFLQPRQMVEIGG